MNIVRRAHTNSISCYFTVLMIALSLTGCNEDIGDETTVVGKVKLLDEFGIDLFDYSGVRITIYTDQDTIITESDKNGDYHAIVDHLGSIDRIAYDKLGFANQLIAEDFSQKEVRTVELIQVSTLEVSNLEVEELYCGTTCLRLNFDASQFFSDKTDKRYFNLHALIDDVFIGAQRFFSFQETILESNQVTPTSSNSASIEIELQGIYFLDDYSPGSEIELRVYGATAYETYRYYDLGISIDNSLNPIYGVAKIKLK